MDTADAIRINFTEHARSRSRMSMRVARQAAVLSMAGVGVFAGLVLLLHVLKPELDPSWRFLSEYALGRYGWVMAVAFFSWGLSSFALFVALRGEVRTRAGGTGRTMLLAVSLALFGAGVFAQDPVTSRPDERTVPGTLHGVASMIGIPGIPIAAVLIGWSVTRHNREWRRRRRVVMTSAYLTVLSLLAMAVYLAVAVPRAGGFGPDVDAGWMNRLVVLTYCLWQIVVSQRAFVVNSHPGTPRNS
jgi:uncharacterized protein DUF998